MTKEQLIKDLGALESNVAGIKDEAGLERQKQKAASIRAKLYKEHGLTAETLDKAMMDVTAPQAEEASAVLSVDEQLREAGIPVPTGKTKRAPRDATAPIKPQGISLPGISSKAGLSPQLPGIPGDIVNAGFATAAVKAAEGSIEANRQQTEQAAGGAEEPAQPPKPSTKREVPRVTEKQVREVVENALPKADKAAANAAPEKEEPAAPVKLPRYSRRDAQIDEAVAKGKWRPNKTYGRSGNEPALPEEVPPHLQGKVDINWNDSKQSGAKLTPKKEWRQQFQQGTSFTEDRVARTAPATMERDGLPAIKMENGIYQQRVDKYDPSGRIIGENYVQIPKPGDSALAKHFGDAWNRREGEAETAVRQRRGDMLRNFVKPDWTPAVSPSDTDKELNAKYGIGLSDYVEQDPSKVASGEQIKSQLPETVTVPTALGRTTIATPLNTFKTVSNKKYGAGFATAGKADVMSSEQPRGVMAPGQGLMMAEAPKPILPPAAPFFASAGALTAQPVPDELRRLIP